MQISLEAAKLVPAGRIPVPSGKRPGNEPKSQIVPIQICSLYEPR